MYGNWTTQQVINVVERPSSWANTAAPLRTLFALRKGEKITALTGVVVFRSPGRARILKPVELDVFSPGFPKNRPDKVPAKTSDIVFLLTYHGESSFTAWFENRIVGMLTRDFKDLDIPNISQCENDCPGEILSRGESEWWVQVRNNAGRIGWVRTNPKAGDFLMSIGF